MKAGQSGDWTGRRKEQNQSPCSPLAASVQEALWNMTAPSIIASESTCWNQTLAHPSREPPCLGRAERRGGHVGKHTCSFAFKSDSDREKRQGTERGTLSSSTSFTHCSYLRSCSAPCCTFAAFACCTSFTARLSASASWRRQSAFPVVKSGRTLHDSILLLRSSRHQVCFPLWSDSLEFSCWQP